MTLQEALDIADEMKPNMMKRETKIRMLMDLENMIFDEILMKHEHAEEQEVRPDYTDDSDPGTVLIVPDPYSKVYWKWLMAQIDTQNQEDARFNIDMTHFDNAYSEMSAWWNRTYMPIQQNRELRK
jgi:hypothetical protein